MCQKNRDLFAHRSLSEIQLPFIIRFYFSISGICLMETTFTLHLLQLSFL